MLRVFKSTRFGPLVGAILLLASTATVAFAEGTSSINPFTGNTGWESSNFWDNRNDFNDTKVTFKAHCDDRDSNTADPNEWAQLQLLRFAGIFPWEDRGQILHYCGNASNVTWNWGTQAAPGEWFKWKLLAMSGNVGWMDVPSPGVSWSW